jgi:ADP-heptose:LPS heptosyltransferase
MTNPIDLFFRITNRLFAFFMDYLGRTLRDSRRLDPNDTFRRSLLVVRQGGFGDLLFASAAIAELKRRHPYLRIDLMCHPQYQSAFRHTASIDRLLDHRWPSVTQLWGYDYFVFLDGVVECDPSARTENVYGLFAEKYFGIDLPRGSRIPDVRPDPRAVPIVSSRIPGLADASIKLGLQPFANSPVRTPSAEFWTRLCVACLKQMPDATLFIVVESGRSEEAQALATAINGRLGGTRAISAAGAAGNVSELTTLVSMLDGILAPDSSMTHLAAAFNIPAVGIYGPFPSALRTRDYPNVVSIDAPADCAPCFTHGHWPCRVARKAGVINSPCFDSIAQAAINESIGVLVPRVWRRIHAKEHREYIQREPNSQSETGKFRGKIVEALADALEADPATLCGVEVGTGGAPLIEQAISVDLPIPYTKCGMAPIHLKGRGERLGWLTDGSMDYLYSSHLFEDFASEDNREIFREWLRVVRPGGVMALLLPDQERYLRYCSSRGQPPNEHHKIPTFGPEYMADLVRSQEGCALLQIVRFWTDDPHEYNFLVLARKHETDFRRGAR